MKMKNNISNKSVMLFLIFLLLSLSCENNYEWSNPLDAESTVLPESWAPKNLQAVALNDAEIELTWQQDEERIEGFSLERKVGTGSWLTLVQLEKVDRSYTDSDLDMTKLYSYKICAIVGSRQSGFSNIVETTLIDIDGNVYKTIKIGNQWWMAENLRVTRYRNGESIPNITDNSQWANLTTGACCAYNNNNRQIAKYGLLYNWYAVNDSRGLAPAGWHVPTDTDWQTLVDYLGGSSVAGGKLKATGTIEAGDGLWRNPNSGATNESGFTALPGGYRHYLNGNFGNVDQFGYWWSSTEYSSSNAWARLLRYSSADVNRLNYNELDGFSVRCIRD